MLPMIFLLSSRAPSVTYTIDKSIDLNDEGRDRLGPGRLRDDARPAS